jgi:hypothetical protein
VISSSYLMEGHEGSVRLHYVRLKAPHWTGYSSKVRRDWKQVIGRKLAHTIAEKAGLGECPKKRGSPEE